MKVSDDGGSTQAHMELDIQTKISLLNGVTGDPEGVAVMLQRRPDLLSHSEVSLQVRSLLLHVAASAAPASSAGACCCLSMR